MSIDISCQNRALYLYIITIRMIMIIISVVNRGASENLIKLQEVHSFTALSTDFVEKNSY